MTQTLEVSILELIQRWNLGQIPADATVSVTFEERKPIPQTPLFFGMFQGDFPDLEWEDFQIAEYRGDRDDGLEP